MQVAVLGTGLVGQVLARGFITLGHTVTFGSRDPAGATAQKAVAAAAGARAATFADAANSAELAVLATPWDGTQNAITLAGAQNLAGKIVLDVTNPLDFSGGAPTLALGFDTSGGELVQGWLPRAHVVKAFNSVGNGMMFKPKLREAPTMFIAGNDAGAKQRVAALLKDFGWASADLGAIQASRLLEPFAMVWITHAFKNKTFMFALTPVSA